MFVFGQRTNVRYAEWISSRGEVADEFDVAIAGGGIAGLTAAVHAARLGRSTLVLAGARPAGCC